MDEFTLWMQSLDPVAVAGNESFHSKAHRDMVANHQISVIKARVDEAAWKRTVTEMRREAITRNKIKKQMEEMGIK